MSNLDGALVWKVVSARHHLKVEVGDTLSRVEDFFEGEQQGLVGRNKQNRKTSGKAVQVLRHLDTRSVATDRKSLGDLVGAALDGAWSC